MEIAPWIRYAVAAMQAASEEVRKLYATDVQVWEKADASLVTTADIRADEIIWNHLSRTPFPVCSEERFVLTGETAPECFWLVDPIDGTTEFVEKTGEFTINIALIYNQKPVLGLMEAPVAAAPDQGLWMGIPGQGLFHVKNGEYIPVKPEKNETNYWKIMGSRRDMAGGAGGFPELLKSRGIKWDFIKLGSSLKFLRIARGLSDAYPRSSRLCHWDIAAGHALVEAAGGSMGELYGNAALSYRWDEPEMPGFLALAPGRNPESIE